MKFKSQQLKFLLFACPVFAYASTTSGTYVGLGVGISNQVNQINSSYFDINSGPSTLYEPRTALVGRLNIGYNFSKFNGVELGSSYNFAQPIPFPNGTSSTLQGTAVDLSYLPNLPLIMNKWSIFGRIGASYNWMNLTSASLNANSSTFADVLGAGIKYNLNRSNSMRLQWISNGLIFPIGINNSSNVDLLTQQNFILDFNFHF